MVVVVLGKEGVETALEEEEVAMVAAVRGKLHAEAV